MIDITEIVGTVERGGGTLEVCATARGGYDDVQSRLDLLLDCHLRPVDLLHRERHLREGWLPAAQHVSEGVAWEESSLLAREIFQRWVSRVRQSIPSVDSTLTPLKP